MKRFSYAMALTLIALTSLGAMFITQHEAIVSGALSALKFESLPPPGGIVGAPPKLKVNKDTIAYLQKLMDDKKVIEVQGDGSIKIVDEGAK